MTAVLIQAALNGRRSPFEHPATPVQPSVLAFDARTAVALGAGAIHIHPRDSQGEKTLEPKIVNRTVAEISAAAGVPVGVSTGAWIEPDPGQRIAQVRGWSAPDFASVNLSEPGALEVMAACESAGIGIEAGVWNVADAERLAQSPYAARILRVLVELIDITPNQAREQATGIHHALDRGAIAAPRVQHGEGSATWPMFSDALARGLDVRMGFEDTLEVPNGHPANDNSDLICAAIKLISDGQHKSRGVNER